jgi:hypothetical protein
VVPGDIVMIGKERLERKPSRPTIDILYEDRRDDCHQQTARIAFDCQRQGKGRDCLTGK